MKKGKLFDAADDMKRLFPPRRFKIESTGEYRQPKVGEWYISGAIPEGYKALNDLSVCHQIGRLVEVKIEVKYTVVKHC